MHPWARAGRGQVVWWVESARPCASKTGLASDLRQALGARRRTGGGGSARGNSIDINNSSGSWSSAGDAYVLPTTTAAATGCDPDYWHAWHAHTLDRCRPAHPSSSALA